MRRVDEQTEKEFVVQSVLSAVSLFPQVFIIDGDVRRAQQVARILALAEYRPLVATTPTRAFERFLREGLQPEAVLLGQTDTRDRFTLTRLLEKLAQMRESEMPILPLPASLAGESPLQANAISPHVHQPSQAGRELLNAVFSILPETRITLAPSDHSIALDLLPAQALTPKVSAKRRSRNSHFRQVLTAARHLMRDPEWYTLLEDVGLGMFTQTTAWPPDNDEHEVPPEYLSCLNQAVLMAQPDDPIGSLRRWSDLGTKLSLEKRTIPAIRAQLLKIAPRDVVMSTVLTAYTHEMNDIRGETLHQWHRWPNGTYWLIHWSNLYAYGRVARERRATPASTSACHVWVASIEATLRLLQLERGWIVNEIECSSQTQTGHCIFALQRA